MWNIFLKRKEDSNLNNVLYICLFVTSTAQEKLLKYQYNINKNAFAGIKKNILHLQSKHPHKNEYNANLQSHPRPNTITATPK